MAEEIFLTVRQAAIILKVHPLSIRRYIRYGKLKAVKAAGIVRIPKSALDNFGEEVHRVLPTRKSVIRVETRTFNLEDPLFRLKGRGLSIKSNF